MIISSAFACLAPRSISGPVCLRKMWKMRRLYTSTTETLCGASFLFSLLKMYVWHLPK